MLNYKLIECAQPLIEDDFKQVEQRLGIEKFPESLKKLYLQFNGGEIEKDKLIYLDQEGEEWNIHSFFSIKYRLSYQKDDFLLLENITEFYIKERKDLLPNYIVFAEGLGGLFCCDIETEKIYGCYFDDPEDDLYDRMKFLANSVEELINGAITEEEFEKLDIS